MEVHILCYTHSMDACPSQDWILRYFPMPDLICQLSHHVFYILIHFRSYARCYQKTQIFDDVLPLLWAT